MSRRYIGLHCKAADMQGCLMAVWLQRRRVKAGRQAGRQASYKSCAHKPSQAHLAESLSDMRLKRSVRSLCFTPAGAACSVACCASVEWMRLNLCCRRSTWGH